MLTLENTKFVACSFFASNTVQVQNILLVGLFDIGKEKKKQGRSNYTHDIDYFIK